MPKQHYRAETFHMRESIGYLVKRAQRLIQERIESKFAQRGCTLQQWLVMMHIRDGLALTVADLCRELNHDSGAMTRLIDQLEDRKLIERRRNPQDRRVIELSLTTSGDETVEALILIAIDMLNTTMDGFTHDEVKLFKSMLRRLIGRLEELAPHSAPAASAEQTS